MRETALGILLIMGILLMGVVWEVRTEVKSQSEAIKLLSDNQLLMLKRERKNVVQKLQQMKEEGENRDAAPPQE
jgi:hypothetical protein